MSRTVFEEFAEHRAGKRGREEIGWAPLGTRTADEATVLATLPAGASRDASRVHVRFNANAQAVATRAVLQRTRALRTLGVIHTHPGSMRHPSSGDLEGDRVWVRQLWGRQGVFAIGTADAPVSPQPGVAWQPETHVQCWGELRLTWYSLDADEAKYRPLDVGLTLGPDLARPLREVWGDIEAHAEALERLSIQQRNVRFGVISGVEGPAFAARLPLKDSDSELEVQLEAGEARYVLWRDGEPLLADVSEPRIDRGVYLILAELASQKGERHGLPSPE